MNTLTTLAIGITAGWLLAIVFMGEQQRVDPGVVVGNCRSPSDTYEIAVSRTWLRADGVLVQQCQTHLDLYALHRDYTR